MPPNVPALMMAMNPAGDKGFKSGLDPNRCPDEDSTESEKKHGIEPSPVCLRDIRSRIDPTPQDSTTPTYNKDLIYYCEKDMVIQERTSDLLDKGCYYYGDLTSNQARILLKSCKNGTYLIRDSSDPKHLYSLSVKTERGPTSVRINYFKGKFQFDCERGLKSELPQFDCIFKLVDYYVRQGRREKSFYRWLENSGRKDLKMVLIKPRLNQIPSLKHLSRLAINKSFQISNDIQKNNAGVDSLPFPDLLKLYLKDYPYVN